MSQGSKSEEGVVPLARKKMIRGGHRGTVSKYIMEADHLVHTERTDDDTRRLQVIRTVLQGKIQILQELNEQILASCEVAEIEDEIDKSDDIHTRILCILKTIDVELGKTNTVIVSSERIANNIVQGSGQQDISYINSSHVDTNHVKPKLPKLTITKFNGDVTKFQTFWDIFDNSVNQNSNLSNIDKFNYLQGLLEGSAYRAIQGLSLTDANYQAALNILQERFGNVQMIISAHMDDLLKVPACDSEHKLSQLRFVYDKVSMNIRGLEALGVTAEQYGSFLIPVIMSKLPHDICVQVARLTKSEVWKIQDMLEVLRGEIQARELSASIKAKERTCDYTKSVHTLKRNSPATASTFAIETNIEQTNWVPNCAFCNEQHYSSSCNNVTDTQKRRGALRDRNKCFLCFKTGHISSKCNSGKRCKVCSKKHHHSICEQGKYTRNRNRNTEDDTTPTNTATVTTSSAKVLLQTATAYVSSETVDQPVKAKILFDSGSQRSYVTNTMASKLMLQPIKSETLNLNTFGSDNFTKRKCNIVTFDIVGNEDTTCVQALSYPKICSPLNSQVNVNMYPHLGNLELADDGSSDCIDILIGSDFYWDILTGEVIRGDSGPVALGSKLGWILSGQAEGLSVVSQHSSTNLIIEETCFDTIHDIGTDDELIQQLKRFWDVESIGIHNFTETEQSQFLPDIHFDTRQQRYEVSLPWKDRELTASSMYSTCQSRLYQLKSRLKNDPTLFEEYDRIIQEQEKMGIIEPVSDSEWRQEDSNFLPHHGVVKQDRQTTKLRIVFDGSAKERKGISLNDRLETGPNLMPHIFDILVNFRTYTVGLTADIEKAFHQISIDPDDRRKLRFLWFDDFKNFQNPSVKQYQFCRLVFGLTSSPAILNSTIQFHLDHYITTHDSIVKLLKNSLYVDDLVAGANTSTDAVKIYNQTNKIMKEGGFNFRKWRSNDETLQDSFEASYNMEKKSEVKVLGIVWNTEEDNFRIDMKDVIEYGKKLLVTKRSILKISAKIFDPLGMLTPFTVHFKIIFQQLCQEKRDWDAILQGEMKTWWNSLFDDFELLSHVRIPRCYLAGLNEVVCRQLHGFCDASQEAYAAVVYLRIEDASGERNVKIVASKTRVSPIKKQTIPRLELLGATLLSRLMSNVLTCFQTVAFTIHHTYYWTDSFTALCWIKNEKQWKSYIQHRVDEIHKTSSAENWRFCPGSENIADLPSRSCSGKRLLDHKSWWNGPQFLHEDSSKWPTIVTNFENDIAADELLKKPKQITHSLSAVTSEKTVNLENIIDISLYSSKLKLLRVTSLVIKFISILQKRQTKRQIEAKDIKHAEHLWIKSVQATSFRQLLPILQKDSQTSLNHKGIVLFVNDGMICCRSRISNADLPAITKKPILLPTKHRFTELTVEEIHHRTLHSGVRQTLDSLRQSFWIIRGRAVVKKILRQCVVCKRYEGRPYKTQQMAELPEYRVSEQPPFSFTGVDYAGPLILSDQQKAYVCLFTCASTRAVHFELTPDLSVKSFLEAFRRFTSRRGLPYKLISDNAKTFRRGAVDIRKIVTAPRTQNFMTNHQVSWEFIIEKAPWWGGFWERMVQLLKRCLKKTIGRSSLSFEELRTLVVEIESTINNRPITYVYDDENGIAHALTPSDMIYGRRSNLNANDRHCDVVSTYNTLTRRVKHHFRLLTNFTNTWKREYLLGLREYNMRRHTSKTSDLSPTIDDIVIIKDEQSARCYWKLGKVVETFKGRDGMCRAASVQVLSTVGAKKPIIIRRPIQQLVPIEVSSEMKKN